MEIAELFVVSNPLDLAQVSDGARALDARYRRLDEPGSALRDALLDSGIATEAAAIVDFVLEDFDPPTAHRDAVHELCTLVLAIGRDLPQLRDFDEPADLDALATCRDLSTPAGPLSRTLARLLDTLRQAEGWELGGPALVQRLSGAAAGYAQARRLEEFGGDALTPSLSAASRAAWKEALVEAACVVCNDRSRATRDDVANVVGRLLGSVVGLAPELGPFLHGEGDKRSVELITQRFAVPSHIVQLTRPQIARALRATLELEVRDLLDAVRHLDPEAARPHIVRRFALGVLSSDGSAGAVVTATSADPPDREEVMGMMRAIARADGKITADERALLRNFDTHLHSFGELVERIEEDRVVDFDEFEQLREMRQTILDDMFRVALSDANVENDERQLLLRAMELLPSLRCSAPNA